MSSSHTALNSRGWFQCRVPESSNTEISPLTFACRFRRFSLHAHDKTAISEPLRGMPTPATVPDISFDHRSFPDSSRTSNRPLEAAAIVLPAASTATRQILEGIWCLQRISPFLLKATAPSSITLTTRLPSDEVATAPTPVFES